MSGETDTGYGWEVVMKKVFGLILLMCTLMMTLTGCGSKDFDGKWDCVEADVQTYGNAALNNAYDTIEDNDGVFLLCQVKIDGKDIEYNESTTKYKVSNVKRSDDIITFTATGLFDVDYEVRLELSDDGKQITAYRDGDIYTLERSDFVHRVLLGQPLWVYLVLGGVIVLFIVGKVLAIKNKKAQKQQPQFNQPQQYNDPNNPFQQ